MIARHAPPYKFRAKLRSPLALTCFAKKSTPRCALYFDMTVAAKIGISRPPLPQSAGFILVATLFAIAVIGIGAAYFASRVDGLRSAAFLQNAESEANREIMVISQTLMQAALVNPITERGLVAKSAPNEPLVLDGRWYRISDTAQISIQDERGLISLNINDDQQLRKLLSAMGVPVERHDRLIDTLRDYVDIDDLKRLNGAERRDYAESNLPPPANDFFASRDELRRIPGWRDLINELEIHGSPGAAERFMSYFSVHRLPAINANTAPRLVLQSVGGIDPLRIRALLEQRRIAAFKNLGELGSFTDGLVDTENITLVGADTWRFTYQRDDLAFLIECRIVISSSAEDKAIQFNECRRRPRNSLVGDADIEEFAQIFGGLSLKKSSGKIQTSIAANPSTNAPLNSGKTSLLSPSRTSLNREASQRESDQPQLSWLKLEAGLGRTVTESATDTTNSVSVPAPRQ